MMCMIGVFPPGIRPERVRLEECFLYHNDGWGLAYRDHMEKGVGYRFWDEWGRVPNDCQVVTHFRTATSGGFGEEMAQPFILSDGTLVFHNGVIGGVGNEDESDTSEFVRTVLDKLPPRWWNDAGWYDNVDWALASGKMVLLPPDEEAVIIGRERGVQENGIWWSAPLRGVRLCT